MVKIYAGTLLWGGHSPPPDQAKVLCLRRSDFLTVKTKIKNLASKNINLKYYFLLLILEKGVLHYE